MQIKLPQYLQQLLGLRLQNALVRRLGRGQKKRHHVRVDMRPRCLPQRHVTDSTASELH